MVFSVLLFQAAASLRPISHNRTLRSTTTITCSSSSSKSNSTNGKKTALKAKKKKRRDASNLASAIRKKSRETKPFEALDLFRKMVFSDKSENADIYPISAVLRCCAALRDVRSGKETHGFMIRHSSHDLCTCVSETALVDFYSQCGVLSAAREVFDRMPVRDVLAWTIIITAYSDRDGYETLAMALFIKMLQEGVYPDPYVITALLRCTTLQQGKQLHANAVKNGWHPNTVVGSCLIDMYARNNRLNAARLALDQILQKNVINYNSLLSCLGRVGSMVDQIQLFTEICKSGFNPSQATMVMLLNGCARSGLIGPSKQLHGQGIKRGFSSDERVQGVMVDMYAKCGDLKSARAIFNQINFTKNVAVWDAMIGGYGKHGFVQEALVIFSLMQRSMVRPNQITFVCLLSACSHAGLVNEGCSLFNAMHRVYNIRPGVEHYSCMVDLLCRAGMVREAYDFICRYKCEYFPETWGALLSACRAFGDTEIGEIASRWLSELEPDKSGPYRTMASVYAASGRWGEYNDVKEVMHSHNISKHTGYSSIEVEGKIFNFRSGKRPSKATWLYNVYSICESLNESISNACLIDCFVDWEAQIL